MGCPVVPPRGEHRSRSAANIQQQLDFSRVRLTALAIAARGDTYDQADFTAMLESIKHAAQNEYLEVTSDEALGASALVAMLRNGLSVEHPLVRELLESDRPQERRAVAEAIDASTERGRALLAPLYNDPVGWVRSVVRGALDKHGAPPARWAGIWSSDPNADATPAARDAIATVLTILEITDYSHAEERAKAELPAALAKLTDASLIDLTATTLADTGVHRPSADVLFDACIARSLMGPVFERAGGGWLGQWSTLRRLEEKLSAVSIDRRSPMQRAMFTAAARALEGGATMPRLSCESLFATGDPWTKEAGAWIDAITDAWSIAAARELAEAVGRKVAPEFLSAAQRESWLGRWIDGERGPWMAFADMHGSLGRLAEPMQREKARAFAKRAAASREPAACAWGLTEALGDLYEERDGARDALVAAYFDEPHVRAIVVSDPTLAETFAAPLRVALVTGELREWDVIESLFDAVCVHSVGRTLHSQQYEPLRKIDEDLSAKAPMPPLDAREREAFDRRRREHFERLLAEAKPVDELLYRFAAVEDWTAEDGRIFDAIVDWARGVRSPRDLVGFLPLAFAIGARANVAHADMAERLLDEDSSGRWRVKINAALRALIARSKSSATNEARGEARKSDDGWEVD